MREEKIMKKAKKITPLLLAVSMLPMVALTSNAADTVAAPQERLSLFSEDFEDTSIKTVVDDGAYGIGKALDLVSFGEFVLKEGTDLFSASNEEGTIVVTEFDVKTDAFNSNPDATMEVKLQSAEGSDITKIKLDTASIYMTRGEGEYYRYHELKDGEWHTIRLVTRLNTEAEKPLNTKLYINGNNLISVYKKDYGHNLLVSEGSYDKLVFEVSNGTAYIDNVKVSRCDNLDLEPVNYGQLVTSIRKGDKKVAAAANNIVDATVLSTFNTALDEAKAVYDTKAALADVEVANDKLCKAYADFLFKDESVLIGSVNFKDANGNDAIYMTNGGQITGINVTKLAEYGADGDILVAIYGADGSLLDVNIVQDVLKDIAVDERTTISMNITLPDDVTGCMVKVMAFDTTSQTSPLLASYVPSNAATTIHIVGDSLVQTYANDWPRQGWGLYAASYYDNATLNNQALSGATTRSLIDDYNKVYNVEKVIKPGDYLMVSFMANDEKKESTKRVDRYDFKNFLRWYADLAKSHGAQVIFVTSPPRLTQNNADCYNGGYSKDDYYCQLMEDVAAELNAPIVDVYQKRKDFQATEGYEYVESAMYLCNTKTLALNFPEKPFGRDNLDTDYTHVNEWGAKKIASWIAEEMQNLDCGLRYQVDESKFFNLPTGDDIITSSELVG